MTDGTESADPGGRPRARDRRRGQGELESHVLSVLGAAPGPVTAAWVQERLGGGLAYTTVITILTRLYAKGAVTRTRSGRSFEWTPVADGAGLVALRMRKLLDREDDRDAVLSSFVSALSADDERLLRALLHESGAHESGAPQDGTPEGGAPEDGAGRSPGRGPER
ncbi:BlaI/MecI/CopY family transcriptional regulator [Streptomyces sp. NBC_00237]|uniref:BlaI/MecI/CopY family transcriptional regulator n=1 Tax=Streptomyces sp. NBC_00237 TaxID=2975687 RepID=UPI00225A2C9C|nr:BlaI/MecI/CopY family transcriptional regulator [Streptomyces sp. NBC_00237]MCX5206534.1 BlaI/MecI/CopY family transcriptional regulator [Streptomyces sp. NBC_00237]